MYVWATLREPNNGPFRAVCSDGGPLQPSLLPSLWVAVTLHPLHPQLCASPYRALSPCADGWIERWRGTPPQPASNSPTGPPLLLRRAGSCSRPTDGALHGNHAHARVTRSRTRWTHMGVGRRAAASPTHRSTPTNTPCLCSKPSPAGLQGRGLIDPLASECEALLSGPSGQTRPFRPRPRCPPRCPHEVTPVPVGGRAVAAMGDRGAPSRPLVRPPSELNRGASARMLTSAGRRFRSMRGTGCSGYFGAGMDSTL